MLTDGLTYQRPFQADYYQLTIASHPCGWDKHDHPHQPTELEPREITLTLAKK